MSESNEWEPWYGRGWDAGVVRQRGLVSQMQILTADYANELERKVRRAEELETYLQHKQSCPHWKVGQLVPCTCGLEVTLYAFRAKKGEG